MNPTVPTLALALALAASGCGSTQSTEVPPSDLASISFSKPDAVGGVAVDELKLTYAGRTSGTVSSKDAAAQTLKLEAGDYTFNLELLGGGKVLAANDGRSAECPKNVARTLAAGSTTTVDIKVCAGSGPIAVPTTPAGGTADVAIRPEVVTPSGSTPPASGGAVPGINLLTQPPATSVADCQSGTGAQGYESGWKVELTVLNQLWNGRTCAAKPDFLKALDGAVPGTATSPFLKCRDLGLTAAIDAWKKHLATQCP